MFGRKKKKKEEEKILQEESGQKKEKSKVDKLVMGAIMGVAIGSVVGMTIAPKSGKETRKLIMEKEEKIRKGIIRRFLEKRAKRKQKKQELKKIPTESK
jgi:gas vesicle protein